VIAGLISQLRHPADPDEMARRLESVLYHPDYVTFVAEIARVVVDFIGARLGIEVEFNALSARLAGLVVDGAWHGEGIGMNLIGKIKAWARGRWATFSILTSGKAWLGAHRFFRWIGYSQTGLRIAKRN
jgi:GNAT superfamily N-acetyltransferase